MYKIKQLIDEGLNMGTLSNETKSGIALLETITQGYSVEDEVGHNLDEELYKDVAINYQGAMSEKTKDRLAGKAVEAISEEKIPEPAKVAGNPFIGDAYFKNNPDKVLGEQSLGGRFGSSIMVSGDRDVVDVIDVPQVPKVFTKFSEDISSSDVPKEKIIDKVFENYEKEKAEPKQKPHLKKSISKQKREMISTEQVYNPEFYTVREVAEKENKEISREEMEAFLYADPSIPYKNYIDEFQFAKDDLIKNGFLFYHDGKFVYKWVYLSGDMNVKMTMLKRDEDIIKEQFGEATYEAQKKAILSVMPRQMDISRNDADADSISIIPHSEFAKSFMVQGEEAVFILKEYRFKAKENFNLFDLFLLYLGYLTQRERSAFLNADPDHVVKFVLRKTIKERNEPKAKDPAEAKLAKKRREEAKQKAKEIAEMLFRKMLYEELTSECKMRFKIIWNERYNTTNLPDYKKIPVAFSMSKFIGDQVLTLNTTQRESVAFINYIKSGCLALEVGLGKTIGALACISQALANNYAKKPLIVVPKNVYYQWIKETSGKQERSLEKYVGALHHFPAVRELYNLNESVVYNTKQYTDPELAEIKRAIKNRQLVKDQNAEIFKNRTVPETLFSSENPLEKFASQARKYAIDKINDTIEGLHTHYDSQIQAESMKNPDKAEKLMKQLSEEIAKIRASYPKTFADIYNRLVKEEYTYLVYVTGKFPEVPDGTVTIITEDALKMNKLGTKDSDKISERMYQILSQGDSISDDEDYDEREGTSLIEKIKERVESRLGNAKVTVEDLGCDMLILDEAHHYRKIFTKLQGKVKTDDNGQAVTTVSEGKGGRKRKTEREDTNYTLDSGSPSGVALSAFFLSTYIQMTNPTGNVILLTATPFENNPLEIYSILALANYAELEKAGFASMQDFFDTHMKVDYGYKIKIDGVEKDTILNGYVNLVQLRTIIRNVVLHRTGEQADIQRPEKVIIPYHNSGLLPDNISEIKTSLVPTDDQMELMQNIDMFIEGQLSMTDLQSRDMEKFLIEETLKEQEEIERAQREEEGGAAIEGEEGYTPSPAPKEKKIKNIIDVTLQIESEELGTRIIQAISLKRQVTLSPYLLKTRREANIDPTAEELIESSPKLKYVMACVKSVKDHHEKNGTPVSGQIIYSVIGKNFFPKFKEYLTDPKFGIGFKPEEVAIVSGGMSDNNKEDAKKGFNDGTIKVLIASKSIQVGANLHKKGTVLYHLFYDWNPTDNEQINGRIWRQGAEYSAVRIVYPMVENSIDPFIFQYLENKTNRIKDIWDMAGIKSQMDLSDFDPRKMKTEAMTDPAKRAKLEIEIIKDETLSEIMLTENKLREIRDIPTSIRSFKESMATASSYITSFHWGIAAFKISELTKEKNEKISEIKDELENIQEPVKSIERDRDDKIEEKQSQISEQQDRINSIAEELIADQKALKAKMGDAATDEDDKLLKQLQADYKNLPATAEAEKTRLNKEIDRMNKEIARINADATKKIKALGDLSKKIKALENKIVSITESYAKKEETLKEQAKAKEDLAKSSDNHDGLKEYYTFLMRESTFLLNYLKDPMAEGKRSSDMEQFYYRSQDIILELEKFKNRKAEYERIKIKYLDPMGITDENAEQVVATYQNKVEELRGKITEIDALQDELIAKFTKEYYERLANAKTPEQSAQDFALLNWLLDEKVEQVSAVDTVAEVVTETMDKDYITDQIEMFKMALEDEKDQEQRDYITDQIEMFEMAIQSEPEAPKTPVKVTVKTGMVPTFREGGIISTGYHIIDAFTGTDTTMTEEAVIEFAQTRRDKDFESLDENDELYVDPDITTVPIRDIDQALDYLDEEGVTYERIPVAYKHGGNISGGALASYKDLVDEGLMTEAEFVTFMREKGYKVMKKSVYNEIKNVDDYDFMIKILGYNNLI